MSYKKQSVNVVTAVILLFILLIGGVATSAESTDISDQVRRELIRLINDEGFMDAAIQRGIERYIKKQREAANRKKSERSTLAKNVRPVGEDDHIKGAKDAPISLVEYSDFECPFCKRFHPTMVKLLEKNQGKVNWVYRHFPLDFHKPGAQKEAEAAECVAEIGGNDLFWAYTDAIYKRTTSNGNGFPIDQLLPLATEFGLDGDKFETCLNSGKMADRVERDYQNGGDSGITGTPGTIFINHKTGKVYPVSGAVPEAQLQKIIDIMTQG